MKGVSRWMPLAERFCRYVDFGADDECWQWTGAAIRNGYGYLKVNGKWMGAHRCSYQLTHGDLSPGEYVTHDCDNRGCVNPRHLRRGTAASNQREFRERGDLASWFVGRLTISPEQAEEIRSRYSAGNISMKALGAEYGCTASCIHGIVHRLRAADRVLV